jgi:pimeloyl-ACP methyl ester carboxylesterase
VIYKSEHGRLEILQRYSAALETWPVTRQEMRVPSRHGETFVIASGPDEAPPVVLLHGSATNSASWLGDIAVWSQHLRVYAVDVIGEPGLSDPQRPPLTSGAYSEWLDDVFDGLGARSAALVGLSLGGWLALHYAIRRSAKVSRLVLISPGGVSRNRNILLWALPLLLLGKWGRHKMQERIGGKTFSDPAFLSSPIGLMGNSIFKHFRPRTETLPIPTDAELQKLPMPVMAVLGGKDAFIDAAGARLRLEQNVPHLSLHYFPDGLHFIPGQTEAVLDFLLAGSQ